MLVLIAYTLIFNLTYMSTFQIFVNGQPEPPGLAGFGVENHIKTQTSAHLLVDNHKQNSVYNSVPVIKMKVADNAEENHSANTRQLPKDRAEDVHKTEDKSKNTVIQDHNNNSTVQATKNSISKSIVSNEISKTKTSNGLTEKDVDKSILPHDVRPNLKQDVMQSGALLRGFYVFLGLSVVIMIYFVFRSYRLRHGSQPSTTVRKYGITARRSDMEMRPLELEDDDDDTLFEISNQNTNR